MTALGDFLQQELTDRSLSYDDVRELTGLSKGTISEIVNGKTRPTLNTLGKLADGLKLSLGQLMDLAGFDLGLSKESPGSRRLTEADLKFIDEMDAEELEEFLDYIRRKRRRLRGG